MSSLYGFSKEALFKRLCSKHVSALIDIFYDDKATKEHIVGAAIEVVQFIYKSQGIPLPKQQVTRYNKQSKTGVLRTESLPPTDGAAAQHSLRAYLQLQDWLVLKSTSRDSKEYSWYMTSGGAYEPIQTLDAIAPMNLIKLVSCNCARDCTTRRYYCKNNNVKCIAACGTCHGNQCKNILDDETTDTNDG